MIAIDLGSNTLRAIEIDCANLSFGASFERMVKTADGLKKTGLISQEAVQRIIMALLEMKNILDWENHKVIAKTTAAMRIADNSAMVLKTIYEQTAVSFEIIDAKQEASFTQLAVSHRLELLGLSGEFTLLDVGGASTELIVCSKGKVDSISVNVGIVTMSQSFTNTAELLVDLNKELAVFQAFMKEYKQKPSLLISTAGTPTTMASMKHGLTTLTYDTKIINGTELNEEDLHKQLERLLAMNEEQRSIHVGVGRDSLIITGVEILRVLMNLLEYKTMLVIDDGMREGIALDSCQKI